MEEFLDLRKNTGDDRRRTHDMNTANWIPDLFMKRLEKGEKWTLFSPSDAPDLHDIYGKEFESKYTEYEKKAEAGEIKHFKTLEAKDLWRKIRRAIYAKGKEQLKVKKIVAHQTAERKRDETEAQRSLRIRNEEADA